MSGLVLELNVTESIRNDLLEVFDSKITQKVCVYLMNIAAGTHWDGGVALQVHIYTHVHFIYVMVRDISDS